MGDRPVFYVGSDPNDLDDAREWLEEQLHASWLLDAEITQLQLALTEILTNVLERTGTGVKSELTIEVLHDVVHLMIGDERPPFEPGRPDDIDREGGFGLLLVNLLVDEAKVTADGHGGSSIRLTKHRPEQ